MEPATGGPAPFPIPDSHFKYVVFEDPKWDFRTLDFDRDVARAERVDNGTLTATNPDLNAFIKRGGKLLMYHGWNDQLITAQNSVNYYESVRSTVGAPRTDAAVRLFMAPGMAHCAGGPGPNQADWLAALEQWVERGVAPTRIVASRAERWAALVRCAPIHRWRIQRVGKHRRRGQLLVRRARCETLIREALSAHAVDNFAAEREGVG